ncbi:MULTISPECIES: molybdenum cofactor biosynthesis protein B [unclassified Arthrobacter]|uniref:MogA/MoaB family molybdenum cofactor biosynthesis protein n=1 Tax=unclassified Arthrobacter TaxID=235627 RepID=UPI001D156D8F|nr:MULTISPECIES: MogA/MoaB family molybdenum cofactor biosynthesis protein [unclassified Arthrobacter]MCC3303117.1 MogA/MoaB family molybdenum cofactor biosynthesis protein [Arthrobacter sp. zg-Y895]MCQ1948030.1 MogA/MoaB family molybdenum cofactor biosynthesis protein [Arthrobacter sp. zg-Y1116]MCC3292740.1 MogA/MoaB family molybdenum cofactor biosynthesis protein [Arthrobacter sp. zg-Y1110]MCQ1996067.1 MogA/MoaB family molybdenum cofactor biosynthesis protein [Arthrobacter sp. zg-Y1171]UWX82
MSTPSSRRTAGVLIASTRAAAGTYQDECGPLIADWLYALGYDIVLAEVVPDGVEVAASLQRILALEPSVLLTSGGTGLSPDDVTPESTEPLLDRHVPGVMEAIRAKGLASTPMAAISRGFAGTAGRTFVVNLPGSPAAVADGLAVLEPIIGHICGQLEGKREH